MFDFIVLLLPWVVNGEGMERIRDFERGENMRKSSLGVTVKSASQQLGIPEPAVRVLMRRGKLPIGIAEKISGERYTYYIMQELIDAYLKKQGGKEKNSVGCAVLLPDCSEEYSTKTSPAQS